MNRHFHGSWRGEFAHVNQCKFNTLNAVKGKIVRQIEQEQSLGQTQMGYKEDRGCGKKIRWTGDGVRKHPSYIVITPLASQRKASGTWQLIQL